MLSEKQQKDSDECTRRMESCEEEMECCECSCSVCFAQINTGYDTVVINKLVKSLKSQAEALKEKYDFAVTNTELAGVSDKMADFCDYVIGESDKILKGDL